MAAISASLVKELRERTGLGMMDCKRALKEADGNIEQAIDDLRKSSGMKAAKKAGRTAAEGVVAIKVADDNSYAVMVEVNSETDFIARDAGFLAYVNTVVEKAFAEKEDNVEKVMAGELESAREALVQKIGENVSVRRIAIESAENGVAAGYVHSNNRISVLVNLEGGNDEVGKDVAMHVAAVNPKVVNPGDVSAEEQEREKNIFVAQAKESGKPDDIIEKMIIGRMKKFLAEVSLTEQAFVKDPDVKVGALVKNAGASIRSFARFEVGEGIEVEEVDFAEEVAAQVRGEG